MFKRSFLMVSLILVTVFTSAFIGQMMQTKDLPSSYDSGLTIETAFKTSKVPLLVEFYSDDCGTCRKLTPLIHQLHKELYRDQLTVVMMDVNDPAIQDIARLFGVDSLPALYVFDHRHMRKHQIPPEAFTSRDKLQSALDELLSRLS
ncbi:MAG TPA: thioredoxin domain-containing protein [Oculatellaceae cyanobacterium]|jgi:thiol-disulfide isomerase/thioredoxin